MHVGIPREIKDHEYRVGMTTASVREAVADARRGLAQLDADARR